jgi:hypothetical protein
MRNDAFVDSPVKGDTFLNVIKELERSNYINVVKGGNLSMPFSNAAAYGPGLASRFNASEALVEKLLQFYIGSDATSRHFRRLPSLSELRLKSSSFRQGREKISGKAMRILPSDKIKEIKANLKELNMACPCAFGPRTSDLASLSRRAMVWGWFSLCSTIIGLKFYYTPLQTAWLGVRDLAYGPRPEQNHPIPNVSRQRYKQNVGALSNAHGPQLLAPSPRA